MKDTPNQAATFVATVRMSIIDIAKIGKFLHSQGIYVGTRGKIASEGLKIMAEGVPVSADIDTCAKAVEMLRSLGYGDSYEQDKRYRKALASRIKFEDNSNNHKLSLMEEIALHREDAERLAAGNKIDIDKAKAYIAKMPSIPSLAEIDQRSATEAKKLRRALEVPKVDVKDTGE